MSSWPAASALATATFRARAGPPLVSNTMCSTSRSAREYFSGLASSTTYTRENGVNWSRTLSSNRSRHLRSHLVRIWHGMTSALAMSHQFIRALVSKRVRGAASRQHQTQQGRRFDVAFVNADPASCWRSDRAGATAITACRVRRRDSETFSVPARPGRPESKPRESHRASR